MEKLERDPAPAASTARRAPAQQRSRERLDRILSAASELIARVGSDHVTMSEVAARAGISIGSLYQYFPDKAALVRTLAERYQAENRRCVAEALAGVATLDDLKRQFDALVDICIAMLRQEPGYRDIWSGMQADKGLAALQLAESRTCGSLLAAALRRVRPEADAEDLGARCFLIWELGEAAFRLAVTVGEAEGDTLIAAYKRMSWSEMIA